MESVYGNGGSRPVVTELSHIKDLAMQLQEHLDGSHDRCKHLTSQIFSLTERSIGLITSSAGLICGRKRSAGSATPSPLSNVSDVLFKSTKKRKTMMKHQVRVKASEGGEAPVDDGHSWRKYGQKPILGSKYPRSYYRCRHRHSQGCKAMKKVQRANDDPTLFDVMYFGAHTCVERTEAVAIGQLAAPAREHDPDAHCLLQSLSGSLIVTTEGLAAAMEPEPQGLNGTTTTPFCPSSASPVSWCLSPDIADEFIDIDVISSFFE
ncbi:hypothetical protein PR202_gb22814 [Eleusine coracana subsp. coracana]|uniref:WRKY domain-containing protein n=1 Tax=Eleusine coracana subsp. coracana TaxID=191504 RepID=A0AAV5FIQ3_ELECO|nr:hypothetical protein QOZ80_6BG0486110 [Eleusine coracana subsp. coracana]GJN34170.1 hypothetical protein PR202_gb22814 [Eleusine coracana subsp. coracana]